MHAGTWKLNDAQLLILQSHRPEDVDGDVFTGGDDNDLACVLSRIAETVRNRGDLALAYEIERAAPAGFFSATWDEYRRRYTPAADSPRPPEQPALLPL